MNEIFKELWNLNAKQTFLLVTFIIELLFLIYAFLVYCYEKNETLKLIAFIKKNIFLLVLLLTIPAGLLLLVFILKDTFSLDGWLGFLGVYFGVIGAIAGIWWQLFENKKQKYLGIKKYILHILESNSLDSSTFYFGYAFSIKYKEGAFKKEHYYLGNKEYIFQNYENILFLNFGIEFIQLYEKLEEFNTLTFSLIEKRQETAKLLKKLEESEKTIPDLSSIMQSLEDFSDDLIKKNRTQIDLTHNIEQIIDALDHISLTTGDKEVKHYLTNLTLNKKILKELNFFKLNTEIKKLKDKITESNNLTFPIF